MSFHAGPSNNPDEQLLKRLGRPPFSSASDVLTRPVYDVQPHPALSEASAEAQLRQLAQSGRPGIVDTRSTTGEVDTATLDRPVCTFFLRTGTCAYGDRCKFLHPRDRPPPVLNSRGYPVRPEEVDCAHYLKKGWCAFNLTCKYNHPELPPPMLPGSPYGMPAGQQYINIAAAPGSFSAPAGAIYSLAPSAVPVMYYVPSPIGTATLGNNAYQASTFQGGASALPAGYTTAGGGGLATSMGPVMYRQQQQQQQHMLLNAVVQHQQQQPLQQQQQQAVYGSLPDQFLPQATRIDQISSAMQRLRMARSDTVPRPQQQQQQLQPQQQQHPPQQHPR